jgi:hypothetical protein
MKTNWPDARIDEELRSRDIGAEEATEASTVLDSFAAAIMAHAVPTESRLATAFHRKLAAVAACIALLATASVGTLLAYHSSPRQSSTTKPRSLPKAQLVDFTTHNGEVIATITDPSAAVTQLDATFRAHGLDIIVTALPVSPSLVGSIVYTDAPVIRSIQAGTCMGAGCAVGLVIPVDFHGSASVIVGRAAQPGEAYASAEDAFAPGEVLHCSGIQNEQVAQVLPVLQAKGLVVSWRENLPSTASPTAETPSGASGITSGTITTITAPPVGDYIASAVPISSTTVAIWVASSQPTPNTALLSQENTGC